MQLASEHLGDGSTASPKLPPNRDYRHGRNCEGSRSPLPFRREGIAVSRGVSSRSGSPRL
jgi:hypothetical protein